MRKSKKDEGKDGKWKAPSIKDLQRAALGPHADSIPDEELDEFAASIILKESQAKIALQVSKTSSSSSYFFLEEPEKEKTTTANKVFLANTIRNTSSFNNALRKREERESLAKKIVVEERVRKSSSKLSKSSKRLTGNDDEDHNGKDDDERDAKSSPAASTSAMLKLKKANPYLNFEGPDMLMNRAPKKQRPILAMDEVLNGIVYPGPCGPVTAPKHNEPNQNLPAKCPW